MRNHPLVIPSGARDLLFKCRATAICILGLVAAFALGAQEPVPLAHGNVPGEPHHHLKIENEYVRVYYVEAPPHESTLLHQHDHDYIYVSLGPSDVINAILNKPEIHLQLKDGETHFTRGGFAHVARNLADTPFRNITIELLKPQGEARNLCEKVIEGPLGKCVQPVQGRPLLSPETKAQRIFIPSPWFETDGVRVVFNSLAAKGHYRQPDARFGTLFVVSNDSLLQIELPGGSPQMLHGGEVVWLPRGSSADITSLLETGASHYLTFFLRDGKESAR